MTVKSYHYWCSVNRECCGDCLLWIQCVKCVCQAGWGNRSGEWGASQMLGQRCVGCLVGPLTQPNLHCPLTIKEPVTIQHKIYFSTALKSNASGESRLSQENSLDLASNYQRWCNTLACNMFPFSLSSVDRASLFYSRPMQGTKGGDDDQRSANHLCVFVHGSALSCQSHS